MTRRKGREIDKDEDDEEEEEILKERLGRCVND
jgi:hypothetical protein